MKITHLVLKNFRKYENAKFIFNDRFNVLIGNNGSGKTTLLDALAIMLNTYFQGSGITTAGGSIKKDDARLVVNEIAGQVFRETQSEVWLKAEADIDGQTFEWQRFKGDRAGKAKSIVTLGINNIKAIKKGEVKDQPLMLYYGSGRLWNIHRNIKTEKPGSQLEAYRFGLDPKSDQNAFEKWFKRLSFTEIQKRQSIPALTAVKNAVLCCIPGASDFYHDIEADQIMIHLDNEGLVPFNYLSDGYRNMVAMIADIAHRASKLNPHFADAATQLTKGVVLIDEIDLHLHPKWQRRVVGDLKKTFPNMQFITTTHSPFILQSLDAGEVIDLEQPPIIDILTDSDVDIAAPGPNHEFSNRPIEDIVEDVMGIAIPQRSQRYQEMYDAAKQYYIALQEGKCVNGESKDTLKRKLDELSAPFSKDVAYHAFLEMERIASGLGQSDIKEEKSNASH